MAIDTPLIKTKGWESHYPDLAAAFQELRDREEGWREDCDGGWINSIDFNKPLQNSARLPEEINRFAVFVWQMLGACESGSVGGDACRQSGVLAAAVSDALDFRTKGGRFQHLLGVCLAILNHGAQYWLERGDPGLGNEIISSIGNEWKKLFAAPESALAAEGIDAELRQTAIDLCEGLRKYLSRAQEHFGPYANKFT